MWHPKYSCHFTVSNSFWNCSESNGVEGGKNKPTIPPRMPCATCNIVTRCCSDPTPPAIVRLETLPGGPSRCAIPNVGRKRQRENASSDFYFINALTWLASYHQGSFFYIDHSIRPKETQKQKRD